MDIMNTIVMNLDGTYLAKTRQKLQPSLSIRAENLAVFALLKERGTKTEWRETRDCLQQRWTIFHPTSTPPLPDSLPPIPLISSNLFSRRFSIHPSSHTHSLPPHLPNAGLQTSLSEDARSEFSHAKSISRVSRVFEKCITSKTGSL
ncbi:hypothetical protein AVEN_44708-1 [Araneus ventricosus]|uniref:Uncharacterized protein n=1 Tax=Araneus ventricosus TaxID=182803 RepID=A0A4Y2Q4F7_ARAVE|nr:hypothetical protein AVEN_44708-1 [Araneus ventricosus]